MQRQQRTSYNVESPVLLKLSGPYHGIGGFKIINNPSITIDTVHRMVDYDNEPRCPFLYAAGISAQYNGHPQPSTLHRTEGSLASLQWLYLENVASIVISEISEPGSQIDAHINQGNILFSLVCQ